MMKESKKNIIGIIIILYYFLKRLLEVLGVSFLDLPLCFALVNFRLQNLALLNLKLSVHLKVVKINSKKIIIFDKNKHLMDISLSFHHRFFKSFKMD